MKLFVLFFFSLNLAWGFSEPQSFDSGFINLENSFFEINSKSNEYSVAKSSLKADIVETIFTDKLGRIDSKFKVSKYFEPNVRFWFSVYTQYTSQQVVIHDTNNLKLVYNVIDYSGLHANTEVHRFSKSKLQSQLSLEHTIKIKKILKKLSWANLKKLNHNEFRILNIVKAAGIKISRNKKRRKTAFLKLANSLRTQTGQRDKVYKGVLRSLPYLPYLKLHLNNFRLPDELLAIAFLESSFNPIARSKVAAAGIWQFMPYISNLFMPKITDNLDYRSNPVISSIAAFHLLKENKVNMRRWDLAVTAYNSGTKHLKRAIKQFTKRKMKRKNIGLDYILKNYSHPHLGFASKNFYSEFIALVHVLAYKDIIYPLKGIQQQKFLGIPTDINIYVIKCKLKPKKLFRLLKRTSPHISMLNSHLEQINEFYPPGTLIVSNRKLTSRKYFKVSAKTLVKKFPIHYPKLIKNQKCKS